MGAARQAWNASDHPRGAGGLFSRKVVDVSERHNQGVRGRAAFVPPTSADERRSLKERAPTQWRSAKALYDRRERGGQLSRREEAQISWASPRKMAEQRAKTGDAVVPRGTAAGRIRHQYGMQGSRPGAPRTGIKKTFTGKAKVERGNYRELIVPDAGRPGSVLLRTESRVRRAFDWPRPGRSPAPAKPKPKVMVDASRFPMMSDAAIRELAGSLGLEIPKRAGRNQIIKLIQGA